MGLPCEVSEGGLFLFAELEAPRFRAAPSMLTAAGGYVDSTIVATDKSSFYFAYLLVCGGEIFLAQ